MTWSNSAEECVAYKLSAREPTLNPAASSLTCACPVVSASPTDCVCRKAADARSKVGPRGKGGPADGLSPNSSEFRWCRTWGSIPVRRNRQVQREGWQHVSSLNATSCGLLKQPDKQVATRQDLVAAFCVKLRVGDLLRPGHLNCWAKSSDHSY